MNTIKYIEIRWGGEIVMCLIRLFYVGCIYE